MFETEGMNMKLCPFCKTPPAESDEENFKRVKKLTEKGNANSFYQLAGFYEHGTYHLPQDMARANELYLKAGKLGCAKAYHNLGCAYDNGDAAANKKKAKYYYELAAMNGDIYARHNLGAFEGNTGNNHRAMKHFLLAASAGYCYKGGCTGKV